MKYRAKIDADRVYWGVEQVATLAAGDVEIPKDCDLAPGAYKWDANAFVPLAPVNRKATSAPSTEKALALLIDALVAAKVAIPEYTAAWRAHFATTIDAKG